MRTGLVVLGSSVFVAGGVLLLFTGSVVFGLACLLVGAAGFVALPAVRAGERGETPFTRKRLTHSLVALGLGAVIGVLFLVSGAEWGPGSGRRWTPDSPTESRLFGGVVLVLCLSGMVAGVRRLTRLR
ncbi:hypothetical protein [Amycolatopsis magusensis]|uniref:hypothetical protein n=1 Tax=Amycolatopsis magusensis TaxID=882444 RepID=UPI003799C270